MKKHLAKYLCIFCLSLTFSMPAMADTEIPSKVPDPIDSADKKQESLLEKATGLYEEGKDNVMKAKDAVDTAKGYANDVKKGVAAVKEGVAEAQNTIDAVKNAANDPLGAAMQLVDVGAKILDGMEKIGQKNTQNENAAIVKTTMMLPENATVEEREELNAKIIRLIGEKAAELFAKSLVLRQELIAEEDPEEEFGTIQEYMKASNAMMVQSAKRWNKILEMESVLQEFNNIGVLVGFDQSDTDQTEDAKEAVAEQSNDGEKKNEN